MENLYLEIEDHTRVKDHGTKTVERESIIERDAREGFIVPDKDDAKRNHIALSFI